MNNCVLKFKQSLFFEGESETKRKKERKYFEKSKQNKLFFFLIFDCRRK